MMEYSVTFENVDYDLPKYNFGIADKFEKLRQNPGNGLRDKCERMYKICSEIMGKDKIAAILGAFKDADPNRIQMLYSGIVSAYDDPLTEEQFEKVNDKIDKLGIADMAKLMVKVESLEKRLK